MTYRNLQARCRIRRFVDRRMMCALLSLFSPGAALAGYAYDCTRQVVVSLGIFLGICRITYVESGWSTFYVYP